MAPERMDNAAFPVNEEPHAAGVRTLALICLIVGAAASLALMYWAGHRNPSLLLMLLFTCWVSSPFAGMALMLRRSSRWPAKRQSVTCRQIQWNSIGSALVYALAVVPRHLTKAAGPFLVVPVVSWLLLAVGVWIGARSRGQRGSEPAVLKPNSNQ